MNSLLGTLSTKELPASGRMRNTNNSINENHDKDNFHSKLMNSMKDTETSARRDSTDIPSESHSKEAYSKRLINWMLETVPPESNPTEHTQNTEKLNARNVLSESIPGELTEKADEPTTNDIPTELD